MKKFLYLILLLFIFDHALAQRKFKSSQWEEWDQAALQLEIGNFDTAISVYRLYPTDLGFSSRLKQTQNLKNLYFDGEKLQREKKYSEAIATYKKHRDFNGIGSLGAFEKKIDECIKLLGATSNTSLKNLERQILAAEYSYKGFKNLLELDVQNALKNYNLAKSYGNTASPILKEKYREDLRMIQELINWQQLASKSEGDNFEEKKIALQKYRAIKGIPVLPRIETQIQIVIAEAEGRDILLNFAKNCETNALIYYIQEHKSKFTQSDDLLYKLNQYKSIRNKIDTLSTKIENSETVKSAFSSVENMTKSFESLPEDIKKSLERCLNIDKHKVYLDYSRQSTLSGKYDLAEGFLEAAKEVSLPEKEMEIVEWENKLKAQKALSEKNRNDSIVSIKEEQIFSKHLNEITRLIDSGKCKEAKIKYALLESAIENNEQAKKLSNVGGTLKSCGSTTVQFGLVGGLSLNKPRYKLLSNYQDMNYGLAVNAGVRLNFRDENSLVSLSTSIEYFMTDYNTLNANNQIIENFKIDGAGISLNIKLHIPKTNFYMMVGPEAIIPITYKYKNYSADIELLDRKQLNNPLLSGKGGIGYDNGKVFIEASANYGIGGIYNKKTKNASTTSNSQVNAIFRRAGITIGFWIF